MSGFYKFEDIINRQDCLTFINFINDNLDIFESYAEEGNELRKALRFGIDDVYKTSYHDLSLIPGLHNILKRLFTSITTTVQDRIGGPQLYVTSFHMGKQLPGARVDSHIDCDPKFNFNSHFKHSAVVYLNRVTDGELIFPHQNISYSPNAGDLVVFPAMGKDWEHEVNRITQDRYNLPIWLTEDPEWELSFFA